MDHDTHEHVLPEAGGDSDDDLIAIQRFKFAASKTPHNSMVLSFRQGVVSLEDMGLLALEDHTRSIGGRLGGHFDSTRLSVGSLSLPGTPLPHRGAGPHERSSLLQKTPEELEKKPSASPALIVWIFPALACASAYAFYNIFIKKGSASIHPILGGVVLQFVAALLGTILLLALLVHQRSSSGTAVIDYDRKGLMWAVCAGLAVGTAEMLSFCVSGMGVPATHFIPIIIGGSVMFGAVLGLLILGEKMMLHGWSGVFLLCVGIALVATDPGDKVEEAPVGDGAVKKQAPPLIIWIGPALICASAYAFYNIFIKKGSASINPILGGVVLQFVAAIFGSLLLGLVMLHGNELEFDSTGLFWACMAGVAVGTAEMLSFVVSGMGVQATQSIPVIIGGSVMFGAVLGLLLLGESMMFQGWFGVALLMTGIGFVATDPGEKVAGH